MEESRNVYDLLGKIEWEGGMFELINGYGMTSIEDYDVPDELKDEWEEVSEIMGSIGSDLDTLYHKISIYATKYGNKETENED